MYVKSLELTVYIIMKKINPSEWELYNYIKYLYNYNSAHDSWMRDIDSIDTVYDMNSEYILDSYLQDSILDSGQSVYFWIHPTLCT